MARRIQPGVMWVALCVALCVALWAGPAISQVALPAEVHPSLLFTEDRVPDLRQRLEREPYATWWATIHERALNPPNAVGEERTKARYAKAAAFAWWMTGDDTFARTAAALLLDMRFPPDGGDLGEPHNEGEVVMQYAQAYDLLHPFLEAAERAQVRDQLAREADRLFDGIVVQEIDLGFLGSIKIRLHETTDPRDLTVTHLDNWHIRAYGGLGLAAFALAEHPGTGGSAPQEWADHAFDLVSRSLTHMIETEDGGYAEGPFYARYAADVYLPYLLAVRSLTGLDLFLDPRLQKMHDWSLNLRLPNGRRPNIDDGHLDDFYGHYLAAVDADGAVHHWDWLHNENGPYTRGFNEPDAIAFYDDTLPASPPTHGPTVFMPGAGDAVFRSDWSAAATYLLLRGEHGRARAQGFGHEHADETSFLLYAHGEMLAVDGGYINFTNHDKVNAGRSHSLILVDGQGPPIDRIAGQAVDGGNDAFIEDTFTHPAGDYAEVRAEYGGTGFRRRVLFADRQYFVVADAARSLDGSVREFAWRLHGHGGGSSGGSYVRDGSLARWTRAGAELLAYLPPGAGRTFAEGDTIHSFDFLEEPTHTFLEVTESDSTTQFLAVLFPRALAGESPTLDAPKVRGGQAVRIGREDGAVELAWVRAANADTVVLDDGVALTSDGAFGWLRLENDVARTYSLQDGTWLAVGAENLVAASDTVDLLLTAAADSAAGFVRGPDDGYDLRLGGIDSVATARFAGAPTTATRVDGGWQLTLAGEGRLRLTTVAAVPAARPGDFDADGDIDLDDFFLFVDVFGLPVSGAESRFDLNADGVVGFPDLWLFSDIYGT